MKKLTDRYTMGFEPWALVLFAAIMLPNILWGLFPAPNDVLRAESVTPAIDTVGMVFQAAMIFCLALICRTDRKPLRLCGYTWAVLGCVLVYWLCWGCYYMGLAHAVVLLAMTLVPCAAFILLALERRNGIALIPAVGFTLCHVYFAFANFLMPG